MLKRAALLVGALAAVGATVAPASAQYGRGGAVRWQELGCVEVSRRADFDTIRVGLRDGRFRAIRLSASGNDVMLRRVRVIYGNGSPDDLPVASEVREGDTTRPIDLQGRDRFIDRIEIVSQRDFRGRGRGRARLCVAGLVVEGRGRGPGRADWRDRGPDRGAPPPIARRGGNWVELGCQRVGLLADRDVVRVGRREGRFKSIRLSAAGNSVYVMNVRVIYANGEPDDIGVRTEIRENGMSPTYDLRGRERAIDRVELFYRAKPNFRGSARVCVHALD